MTGNIELLVHEENQSEFFEEIEDDSIPFPDSSPLAKDEGFPWLRFSSLPFARDFPGLTLILLPNGKGSCSDRLD